MAAFIVAACTPRAPTTAASARDEPDAGAVLEKDAATDDAPDASLAMDDHDGDAEAEDVAPAPPGDPRCPEGTVAIETADRAFCIDRFEASLVEVLADGSEQPYPHFRPVDGHAVRAVSVPDVFPQGFISEVQAEDACSASGKRLCRHAEWKTACMGPEKTAFPYGEARKAGTCHDQGKSAVLAVFGAKAVLASAPYGASSPGAGTRTKLGIAPTLPPKGAAAKPGKKPAHVTTGRAAQTVKTRPSKAGATATKATAGKPASKATKKRVTGKASARPSNVDPGVWARLNEPALGQVEGALAKTGAHPACVNAFGAEDMVGNLHEWVATDVSLPHGTFAGGYYLDTALNGDGCNYKTVAHAHDYHDYSTGFRCCADLATAPQPR